MTRAGLKTLIITAVACVIVIALVVVRSLTGSNHSAFDLSGYRNRADKESADMSATAKDTREYAVLGGGCFWCIEAVYERIEGVGEVVSGYAGGTGADPSYQEVSTGRTGHAEVIRVEYDPQKISYKQILEIFFKSHDPTTLNRQGADVGTQYRSIVLYANDTQRKIAEAAAKDARKLYDDPIVTQIEPLEEFYEAEDYHQDYYRKNPFAGYCQVVISPKLRKLGLTDPDGGTF